MINILPIISFKNFPKISPIIICLKIHLHYFYFIYLVLQHTGLQHTSSAIIIQVCVEGTPVFCTGALINNENIFKIYK